ncbi:MAG: DUF2130 domain-containing protein, partial [Oscillospiraceae bacterium]|nr:DUF2130 domain-containing protein [Oscillospiraceae bacterium]
MNEIKCPACGKVFQVDESGYAQILHQVRDKEFEKEIASRLDAMDREKEKELTIMRMQQQKNYDDRLSEYESSLAEKDSMIKQLEERLSSSEKEKRYAVNEAVREKEIENDQIVGRKNDVIVEKDRE